MTVLQSSMNWVVTNFDERLGDDYVYGGDYSPADPSQGCDCSFCAGWVLEAVTKTPANMSWAHNVSTESWPYDYNTNTPAAPGTVGPYGTICVGSDPSQLPGDAAVWINIMHGGGGADSHMNAMFPNGFIMESNGNAGSCTNGTGGVDQRNPEWTDHWYLPGPVTQDAPPVGPAPAPAPDSVLWGIDISNNNFGGPATPNLGTIPGFVAEVAKEGFSWIEAKVSEGASFADPTFTTIYHACQANNILCVGYHFVNNDDPRSQAQNFKAALNGVDVPVMLDWELGSWPQYQAVWQAFVDIGLTPALEYIPHWYWQQEGSPNLSDVTKLVSSSWVNGTGYASALYPGPNWNGWNAYGGSTPVICQFTNQAQVAGMALDADAFRGTLDDFKTLLGLQGDNPLMALTSAQQEDLYNWSMWTFALLFGALNNNPGNVTPLPGSPTPTGNNWPLPEKSVADSLAAMEKSVGTLSADFSQTATGLAVLQKLAELNAILAGIPQNPSPTGA